MAAHQAEQQRSFGASIGLILTCLAGSVASTQERGIFPLTDDFGNAMAATINALAAITGPTGILLTPYGPAQPGAGFYAAAAGTPAPLPFVRPPAAPQLLNPATGQALPGFAPPPQIPPSTIGSTTSPAGTPPAVGRIPVSPGSGPLLPGTAGVAPPTPTTPPDDTGTTPPVVTPPVTPPGGGTTNPDQPGTNPGGGTTPPGTTPGDTNPPGTVTPPVTPPPGPGPVPEPASWVMMMIGFGLIGWTQRRLRRKQALHS